MNKKKINFYFILLVISLSYITFVFSYDHYLSIDFIDHDEGYLIEQLLLKIGIFDIKKVVTSASEYGVDFYYFKNLFLILDYIFELDPIHVFRIKTSINGFASIYAFFIIYKIFDILKLNWHYYLVFLLLIISTPEIFRLSVSLKPDLNLLFFSITLTYYFFIKSNINQSSNSYYFFLFFLALSLCIKAWAFPFIVLLLFNRNYYFKKYNNLHKILFSVLLIFFFYLINSYFYNIKEFIITNNDFISFFNKNKNNFILLNITNLFQNNFYNLLIVFNFFLILLSFITLKKNKYNNILKKFFIFGIIWFILWYPYISDLSTFTKTIIETSYSTVLNKESIVFSNQENIISYIFLDLYNFKLNFGILVAFILSPLIIIINRNKLKNNFQIIFYLMLTSFCSLIFVNYITDYYNQYPAKFLYFIFLYIFLLYLIDKLNDIKLIKFGIIPLIYISSIIMIFQNFNTYLNYKNFLFIEKDILNMVSNHEKKISFKNKRLISCGTHYPSNKDISNINLITKSISECDNENFMANLNHNDLIYYEYNSDSFDINISRFELVYEDEILMPDRFGKIKAKKNVFYKKKF